MCGWTGNRGMALCDMWHRPGSHRNDHFVGLAATVSASRAEDLGFNSRFLCGNFSRLSHTNDFKFGTPVAILPDAWHYRVSTDRVSIGIGPPSVRIQG